MVNYWEKKNRDYNALSLFFWGNVSSLPFRFFTEWKVLFILIHFLLEINFSVLKQLSQNNFKLRNRILKPNFIGTEKNISHFKYSIVNMLI